MEEQLLNIANSVIIPGKTENENRQLVEVGRNIINVRRLSRDKPTFWINFEDAFKWVGYTTKGNAKRKLISELSSEVHYQVSIPLYNSDTPPLKCTYLN